METSFSLAFSLGRFMDATKQFGSRILPFKDGANHTLFSHGSFRASIIARPKKAARSSRSRHLKSVFLTGKLLRLGERTWLHRDLSADPSGNLIVTEVRSPPVYLTVHLNALAFLKILDPDLT
jgi:hypothetical protein